MKIHQINGLLDLHEQVHDAFVRSGLEEHRADYMKFLIETQLIEEGHPLKGVMYLSKRTKRN